MSIRIYLFILALMGSLCSRAQTEPLKPFIFYQNSIQISLPAAWGNVKWVAAGDSNSKYLEQWQLFVPNADATLQAYIYPLPAGHNQDHITLEWADADLEILKKEKGFQYIYDDVLLQDGKNISLIQYQISPAGKPAQYYSRFYINTAHAMAVFHFSCLPSVQKKWEPIIAAIAQSLKLLP